jgi:hypothetical protein
MRASLVSALVLAGVVLGSMAPAAAQPGVTAPLARPAPRTGPGAHRPLVAGLITFGVTTGLFVAGEKGAFDDHPGAAIAAFVVAPAAGRWYVGQFGVIGMGMRGLGVAVVASGIGVNDGHGTNPGAIGVGVTLMVGGILYDMIGSGRTAHLQNQRRWAAQPTVLATPGGAVAPALAIGGAF